MCCQMSKGGLHFFQFGQSTHVRLPEHKPAIFGMLATNSRNNKALISDVDVQAVFVTYTSLSKKDLKKVPMKSS